MTFGLRHFEYDMAKGSQDPSNAVLIYTDSDNAHSIQGKTGYSRASKWYDIRWHAVRDLVKKNLIRFEVIPSAQNPADGFTKAGPGAFRSFPQQAAAWLRFCSVMLLGHVLDNGRDFFKSITIKFSWSEAVKHKACMCPTDEFVDQPHHSLVSVTAPFPLCH